MRADPIQTLRWSARPWIADGHYVVSVRGRDRHGEAYDYNRSIHPLDRMYFWSIIDAMQNHILRKMS